MFTGLAIGMVAISLAAGGAGESVAQSAREIPVVRRTEVLVLGGSVGAVSAAIEVAASGREVLLVAPRTYLGDGLSDTLALWLEDAERPAGQLVEQLFAGRRVTTPLLVKRELEKALLDAGADFLLASFPTDLLRDESGAIAGVVIANRAGRQAIIAEVVIDATPWGVIARLAEAPLRDRVGDRATFCRRVVLGGTAAGAGDAADRLPPLEDAAPWQPSRKVPAGLEVRGEALSYWVYEQRVPAECDRFVSLQRLEQLARDATYRPGQLRASACVDVVVTEQLRGRAASECRTLEEAEVGHFCPAGVDRLYVLSSIADLARSEAPRLWQPTVQQRLGAMLGRAAAEHAAVLHPPRGVRVALSAPDNVEAEVSRPGAGDIREILRGLRPVDRAEDTVPAPPAVLPVWSKVDVVVIGGGTSGACAAIAAARRGVSVLVVEYQEGLGGVGTVGLIGKPYHGLERGFTAEVPFPNPERNTEHKMEWFRRQIRLAGGEIWLGAIGCGAYVVGHHVCGAVVACSAGRGVVLADVVVDATGNADLAVAAGADAMFGGDGGDIALQGTGLPWRPLANSYVNTDFLLVDESDLIDTWRAFVGTRLGDELEDYDIGSFIQARERRRVVGDHVLSYLDQIAGRTYPDSVVLSGSDYDSHGYPSERYFALIPHTEKSLVANHPAPGGTCYTPYRCLLPRGREGLLVCGLGISMHRDASAMIRMQKDMHNQGYAAGTAAAMAVALQCTPRQLDVKRLQRALVEVGNLPSSVLTDRDSFPLPRDAVAEAVRRYADAKVPREQRCQALAVLLTHPDTAHRLLREAFAAAGGAARLEYAKLLGFLGDPCGVPDLLRALGQVPQWDAKILQGRMAEYAHLPTPVDALILALGYSGDARAVPAVLGWLERLDADVTLSHHRSVALALESLGDPAAAAPLANLLSRPGMSGHAMTRLEPLHNRLVERRRRTGPLREIVLARALYRCGDHRDLGRTILEQYRGDLRGLFARHADAVLDSSNGTARPNQPQ